MCQCIDTVNKRIQNEYEDSDATLDIAHWGGHIRKVVKIRFFYRRKRNGVLNRKIEQKLITPTFCPFCGERLIDDNE